MIKIMTTEEKLLKLPIAYDWAEYKGETFLVMANFEATEKAGKPMVDLAHCLTYCDPIKTVQWDKNKFKPSPLSSSWGK